jgi:mannose-6-phosphate isomerase-like protein (cupin superfamily)
VGLPVLAGATTMPAMSNLNQSTYTEPVIQTLEEATTQAVLGGSITVRLRAGQTDGQLGLVEQVVPGGYPGPAMHVHPDFDETFYVIEGKLGFRVGDQAYEAGPGTVAFVPRGTPHTFANPGQEPARSLVLATPGGFEAYFEALIELIWTTGGLPPEAELRELGIAHGSIPA